jgi:hypothetical protein
MSQWTAPRICAEPRSMAGNVAGPRQACRLTRSYVGLAVARRVRLHDTGSPSLREEIPTSLDVRISPHLALCENPHTVTSR